MSSAQEGTKSDSAGMGTVVKLEAETEEDGCPAADFNTKAATQGTCWTTGFSTKAAAEREPAQQGRAETATRVEPFTKSNRLKIQLGKRSAQKSLRCNECDAEFKHLKRFERHVQKHTEQRRLKTAAGMEDRCPASDLDTGATRGTDQTPGFTSEETANRDTGQQSRVETVTAVEPSTKSNRLKVQLGKHSAQRQYICSECDGVFRHLSRFQRHIRKHTGQKPYSCGACDAAFKYSHHLEEHMLKHTGERPHSCQECAAAFTSAGHLRRHMRTHTGQRPYSCEECGATFSQSSHLKDHTLKHTGERPYTCDQCGASFKQSGKLKIHVRKHTGERPYACDECDAKFSESSSLKVHKRRHTGQRPYACEVCKALFKHSSSLRSHVAKHARQKAPAQSVMQHSDSPGI